MILRTSWGLLFILLSILLNNAAHAQPNFASLYEQTKNQIVLVRSFIQEGDFLRSDRRYGAGVIIGYTRISPNEFEVDVLTNFHVIGNQEHISLTRHNGKKVDAKVVGLNQPYDLVLLRFTDQTRPSHAILGTSRKVKVGEWVYAIGHPGTARWAQNIGTVSNISDDPRMPFIQFDSSIWHGSSGGGLFNKNRELIGIPNLRGQNRTGFAIPIDVIKEHLKELKQGKKTRAGWLNIKGSTIEGLDLSVVQTIVKMGLIRPDIDEGFFVSYVEPNSSAEQAGLRKNDIIMEINGTKVERNPYLNFLIEKTPPGTQVPIKVMREKTTILLIATIEEYPGQTQTPILPIPEEIPKQ